LCPHCAGAEARLHAKTLMPSFEHFGQMAVERRTLLTKLRDVRHHLGVAGKEHRLKTNCKIYTIGDILVLLVVVIGNC
jgi:hypothetical protein